MAKRNQINTMQRESTFNLLAHSNAIHLDIRDVLLSPGRITKRRRLLLIRKVYDSLGFITEALTIEDPSDLATDKGGASQ